MKMRIYPAESSAQRFRSSSQVSAPISAEISAETYAGDTLIEGYRTIAGTTSPLADDTPTLRMDAAILSAARENSQRLRARPARYAAMAAGAAAMGLAIMTSSDHLTARSMAGSQGREAVAVGAARISPSNNSTALNTVAFNGKELNGTGFGGTGRNGAALNSTGINSLVLNAYPAGAELRTASEVQTAGATIGADTLHTAIDLNQPGALDRLARENPFHYAMIRRILAGVDTVPEHVVGRWMKAEFNATDVTYSPVLLTSAPPRKQLTFTLETTRYAALLTLTPDGARLFAPRS